MCSKALATPAWFAGAFGIARGNGGDGISRTIQQGVRRNRFCAVVPITVGVSFNLRSANGYKGCNFRSYLIDRQAFFRLTCGFDECWIPGIVTIRVYWERVPYTHTHGSPLTPLILVDSHRAKERKTGAPGCPPTPSVSIDI